MQASRPPLALKGRTSGQRLSAAAPLACHRDAISHPIPTMSGVTRACRRCPSLSCGEVAAYPDTGGAVLTQYEHLDPIGTAAHESEPTEPTPRLYMAAGMATGHAYRPWYVGPAGARAL
jgi:hypothetical protein